MDIRYSPIPICRTNNNPIRRVASSHQTLFRGSGPPKMPEFLKPFEKRRLAEKKRMSPLATTLIVMGGIAGIVGLTIATHVFLPIALAGIATFVGVFALMMAIFNKTVPVRTKPPEGAGPMTKEQVAEDIRYSKELAHYNRQQKIARIKKFFGIKSDE
jgi:hypothetical protein